MFYFTDFKILYKYPSKSKIVIENYSWKLAPTKCLEDSNSWKKILAKCKIFQFAIFTSFKVVRMPEKSSKIPWNILYISIRSESMRIARACNKQNSFLNSINPLVRRMIWQRAKKYRIAKRPLKIFSTNQICYKNWERITIDKLII